VSEGVSISTREVLLSTAERLFAEHGVASVSLRQIRVAAGQRNESALHYHFGSREGLLVSVLRRHSLGVEQRRNELLAALETDGTVSGRSVVEAYVIPYAELLERGQSARHFLRIRANLFSDPTLSIIELHQLEGSRLPDPDPRLVELVERAFPAIPPGLLQDRVPIAQLQVMQALASRAAEIDSGRPPESWISNTAYVTNLIDMYCGAVGYPVTPQLRSALRGRPSRRRGTSPTTATTGSAHDGASLG